jgi:hypothetical protein
MYDNVFCVIHGSLVGQMLPRVCHLSIINEKKKNYALKCALLNNESLILYFITFITNFDCYNYPI